VQRSSRTSKIRGYIPHSQGTQISLSGHPTATEAILYTMVSSPTVPAVSVTMAEAAYSEQRRRIPSFTQTEARLIQQRHQS